MVHHPPDDRRISSGAVATAWAIVAAMAAAMVVASAIAPKSLPPLSPAQHALPTASCEGDGAEDGPEASPTVLHRDE